MERCCVYETRLRWFESNQWYQLYPYRLVACRTLPSQGGKLSSILNKGAKQAELRRQGS
jgi:hypothetical protein